MLSKFKLWCAVLVLSFLLAGAAGATKEVVVKVGFLGPITGSNAAEGSAARNAFLLAIEEANKSGKYPYTIEVIVVDDQSSENVAVAGAQQIVSDPAAVATSGFWNSGPAAACIPVFKDAEIPLLIWGAIRETLTNAENMPYITRSAPTALSSGPARSTVCQYGRAVWIGSQPPLESRGVIRGT